MAPMRWAPTCCCFSMALILPIVLIVVGEVVLPQMIATRLHEPQLGQSALLALTASPLGRPQLQGPTRLPGATL